VTQGTDAEVESRRWRREWLADNKTGGLADAGAIYHFTFEHALAEAYGETASYDLSSPIGLVKYIANFLNRVQEEIDLDEKLKRSEAADQTAGSIKSGVAVGTPPMGYAELHRLFHVAACRRTGATGGLNLSAPSDDFFSGIRRSADKIRWHPELVRVKGGAQWQYHAFIESSDALYALMASLLMDSDVRKKLSQCQRCQKFYVTKEGEGSPNFRYCLTADCAAKAAKDNSKHRQNKRRAISTLTQKFRKFGERRIIEAVEAVMKADSKATAKQIAERAVLRLNRRAG
jgi:hypothetical protein